MTFYPLCIPHLTSIPLSVSHFSLFTEAGVTNEAGYVYTFLRTPYTTLHLFIFNLSLYIILEEVIIAIALWSWPHEECLNGCISITNFISFRVVMYYSICRCVVFRIRQSSFLAGIIIMNLSEKSIIYPDWIHYFHPLGLIAFVWIFLMRQDMVVLMGVPLTLWTWPSFIFYYNDHNISSELL